MTVMQLQPQHVALPDPLRLPDTLLLHPRFCLKDVLALRADCRPGHDGAESDLSAVGDLAWHVGCCGALYVAVLWFGALYIDAGAAHFYIAGAQLSRLGALGADDTQYGADRCARIGACALARCYGRPARGDPTRFVEFAAPQFSPLELDLARGEAAAV